MAVTNGPSTAWKYDARGRVISETQVISSTARFWTQWSYDARDQVVTQTYPGGSNHAAGEAVTTGYDVWGRPNTLSGTSNYVTSTTYDDLGRVDLVQFGNGQRTDYAYYALTQKGGRLYQIKSGNVSPYTQTQYLEYDYDAAGNVTSLKDYNNAGQVQSFTYDHLDRLTAAQTNGVGADPYNYTYQYNTIGNITSFQGTAYGYTDSAHKHAVTTLGGVQKYWYDQNGNQITRVIGADTFSLTYDPENHLTRVRKNGADVVTFTYGADGERVRAVSTSTDVSFVGSGCELVVRLPPPAPGAPGLRSATIGPSRGRPVTYP